MLYTGAAFKQIFLYQSYVFPVTHSRHNLLTGNTIASTQHGYNIPEQLMIRNDSSIMVSPDTYREVIAPHDARLLKSVNSGSIHFFGNGQHLIDPMLDIPDLHGLDFGQAELMDVKQIYQKVRKRKVALTYLKPSRTDIVNGKAIRDFPTGSVFVYNPANLQDAVDVVRTFGFPVNTSGTSTPS